MLKKKIFKSLMALSMAGMMMIPAVAVPNFRCEVIAADSSSVDNSFITLMLSKLGSTGLNGVEVAAVLNGFQDYLCYASDDLLISFFKGFSADEQQKIKDKFGTSQASLDALKEFIKNAEPIDLIGSAKLNNALKVAGVTDAQLNQTAVYISSVANMGALAEPVLVIDSNNNIKLASDSAIDALANRLNGLSNGVKVANSENIKAILNLLINECNSWKPNAKGGLIKVLGAGNICGTASPTPTVTPAPTITPTVTSTPMPTITPMSTTTPTPTVTPATNITPIPTSISNNIDDLLKNLDIKDASKVAEIQDTINKVIDSASKVIPTVQTNNNETVLISLKEDIKKSIEAVLQIRAKVSSLSVIKAETKVTFEVSASVIKDKISLNLTAEEVNLLKDNKIDTIELKTGSGIISVPVELLSKDKDLKLTVGKISEVPAVLNKENLAALAAFDYQLAVGGEKLTKGSKALNITADVDKKIAKSDLTAVYYIDNKGNIKYSGGKYLNGSVMFEIKNLGQYAVLNYTKKFNDVLGNWISNTTYLQQGIKKLIANGDTNGNFNPNGSITRAEFAAFIARTLQLNTTDYKGLFNDVKSDAWYAAEVEAVKTAGIIDGVGNGNFAPNKNITREEMAKMIACAYSKVTGKSLKDIIGSNKSNFGDFDKVSDWAKDYVTVLEVLKVIEGNNGNYNPLNNSTRAESLKVIVILTEKVGI